MLMSIHSEFVTFFVTLAVLLRHGATERVAHGVDVYSMGTSNNSVGAWPPKFPWNQVDTRNSVVLGEGTFGVATRYQTTCSSKDTTVIKEVKQDPNTPLYDQILDCKEAIHEVRVQMKMAEYGRAPGVFDVHPKECNRGSMQTDPKVNIMMNRAQGDVRPNRYKTAPISLILEIARQLLSGLKQLHKLGYLHRDIKPANTFFESDARINSWEDCLPEMCRFTLADYGLACQLPSRQKDSTCTGFSGTPNYMSPDIITALKNGYRATTSFTRGVDQWALGVSLYEMWAGELPGGLGNRYAHMNDLYQYIKGLSTKRDDWWIVGRKATELEQKATSSDEHRRFKMVLTILLSPDAASRMRDVDMKMDNVIGHMAPVPLKRVCVDPCFSCKGTCRANDELGWECPGDSSRVPIVVTLAVLDAGGWDEYDFKIVAAEHSHELIDLKMLVAEKFAMRVEDAAFYLGGEGGMTALNDHSQLRKGDNILLSPPLREALVGSGSLGSGIIDARASLGARAVPYRFYPYLEAAEALREAWFGADFASRQQALRSTDNKAKAMFAHTLKPIIEDMQKRMQTKLTTWHDFLVELARPHEDFLKLERERLLVDTRERCDIFGHSHCARNVNMHIETRVDYVKVEYNISDDDENGWGSRDVKYKFFATGEAVQTRGKDTSRLTTPTLPGGIPLRITLCKNLKTMKDPGFFQHIANAFVKSESRCAPIGNSFGYTLTNKGVTGHTQVEFGGRKLMEFKISRDPEVHFSIWDGDFILP